MTQLEMDCVICMNGQQPLPWDETRLARRNDPETSKRAAERVDTFKASHEAAVFDAICDAGDRGATYREIAIAARMEPVAVARRLKAMELRGLIERRALTDCSGFESRNGMAVWWKA